VRSKLESTAEIIGALRALRDMYAPEQIAYDIINSAIGEIVRLNIIANKKKVENAQ